MNLSALVPLLFWLVVGLLVGIPVGRRLQRRADRKNLPDMKVIQEYRANIAAVPNIVRASAPMPRPAVPPHLLRNRVDPDDTVELRGISEF